MRSSWDHGEDSVTPRTLAELTTMRVGGPIARLVRADSSDALVAEAQRADLAGEALLVLGGGSNLLAHDDAFAGTVLQDTRHEITTGPPRDVREKPAEADTAQSVCVTASAGTTWDDLVAWSVEEGLSGLEALSGIPGSVGASPVQNVGAYGAEVADTFLSLSAWDRHTARRVILDAQQLAFGYRTSLLKRTLEHPSPQDTGRIWGPTGRWIILDVTFALHRGNMSAPIRYAELARRLGVDVGQSAPAREVRDMVKELRTSKGMVLNPDDHDTWSAGSFFTNPILDEDRAQQILPDDAPRFPAGNGKVKTSAAWLIDHAGFSKGWAPPSVRNEDGTARASLSTKHVLALTNRGDATAADIETLARAVISGVEAQWGIRLVPEPVALGIRW